jgi:hypothetical protein
MFSGFPALPGSSVEDPGCLSRILDPDFYPSRIPDPKRAAKERGKKICCHTFFCSHKFHITPSSGIRKKPIPDPRSRIPDPGVKKSPDPGSGSAILAGRSPKFTKLQQDYTLERNCWSFFSSFCCLRLRITASGLEMLRVKLVSGSSENQILYNKNKHL